MFFNSMGNSTSYPKLKDEPNLAEIKGEQIIFEGIGVRSYNFLITFILFISLSLNIHADTDTFWIDKGVRYKHFRNTVADLMGGITSVKIIKNKNGENEFVIENEKHHD